MTEENTIRSGSAIIRVFLADIANHDDVDEATFEAVRSLHEKGNLTKTRLVKSLSETLDDGEATKT